jgi:hypothetical protein
MITKTYGMTDSNKVALYVPKDAYLVLPPESFDIVGSCIFIAMEWESNGGTDIVIGQATSFDAGDVVYDMFKGTTNTYENYFIGKYYDIGVTSQTIETFINNTPFSNNNIRLLDMVVA